MKTFELVVFGNGSESSVGDTIYVHYQEQNNREFSLVYDCGSSVGKEELLNWLKVHKRTHIDALVFSHTDKDHTEFGAELINSSVKINCLYLLNPWLHLENLFPKLSDGRITLNSLTARLAGEYRYVQAIIHAAEKRNIPIQQPFQGAKIGNHRVLSPSKTLYEKLLQETSKTPNIDSEVVKAINTSKWREETFEKELLDEHANTSAENEMSLVISLNLGGTKILLTGDAGERGLMEAIDYTRGSELQLDLHSIVQIPHHGSRHNLTPALMNYLFGPKKKNKSSQTAFVSARGIGDVHPHGSVVNAVIRRGGEVFVGGGSSNLILSKNREYFNTMPAVPLLFQNTVTE
jgi:beta-lactamase superfamily II metal-dependent hydrolase